MNWSPYPVFGSLISSLCHSLGRFPGRYPPDYTLEEGKSVDSRLNLSPGTTPDTHPQVRLGLAYGMRSTRPSALRILVVTFVSFLSQTRRPQVRHVLRPGLRRRGRSRCTARSRGGAVVVWSSVPGPSADLVWFFPTDPDKETFHLSREVNSIFDTGFQ